MNSVKVMLDPLHKSECKGTSLSVGRASRQLKLSLAGTLAKVGGTRSRTVMT